MSVLVTLDALPVRPCAFGYPLGVWGLLALLAVLNGGFREVVLIPRIGDYAGHVLSTALLVVASLLVFQRRDI